MVLAVMLTLNCGAVEEKIGVRVVTV